MRVALAPLALALTLLVSAGCGHNDSLGPDVGGSCMVQSDCSQRCLSGGDYPGGFCTTSCSSDADCGGGSVCQRKAGGVCLFPCTHSPTGSCSELGAGWRCKSEESISGPERPVCIGDN